MSAPHESSRPTSILGPGSTAAARRSRAALQSATVDVAAKVSGVLATLVLLPVVLRHLGGARYGIWIAIASIAAWLSLLDVGVGLGLQNAVARATGREDRGAIREAISAAAGLGGAVVAVGLLATFVAAPWLDWGRLLNAGALADPAELVSTVRVAAALVLASIWTNLGYAVAKALQRGYWANAGAIGASAGSLVATLVAVRAGASLPVLAATLMAPSVLAPLVVWAGLAVREPSLRPGRFSRQAARDLLSVGLGFLVLQLAVVAIFQADAVIIAHFAGPAEVTPFSVAQRLLALATVAPTAYLHAHWPAYTEASARGDWEWVRRAHRRLQVITTATTAAIAAACVLAGPWFVALWAGPAARASVWLYAWLGLAVTVRAWADVHAILLNGLTLLRWQMASATAHAMVAVALSIALGKAWGAMGVAAAGALAYLAVSAWALPLGTARALARRAGSG